MVTCIARLRYAPLLQSLKRRTQTQIMIVKCFRDLKTRRVAQPPVFCAFGAGRLVIKLRASWSYHRIHSMSFFSYWLVVSSRVLKTPWALKLFSTCSLKTVTYELSLVLARWSRLYIEYLTSFFGRLPDLQMLARLRRFFLLFSCCNTRSFHSNLSLFREK